LSVAERRKSDLGIDVIILARGGGSLEDLQSFNDENVARAIHKCSLPVISAVGHETDVTIADFVADLRAPTPTAAAEVVSPDQNALLKELLQVEQTLQKHIKSRLDQHKRQVEWLGKRLQHPGRRLQEQAQTLDRLDTRLTRVIQQILQQQKGRVQLLARTLDTVSPLQTLQRGFSISQTEEGQLITQSTQVTPGDRIFTKLKNGRFSSIVEHIN
jgi:exodeoxyribonuclease VII large subunit